MRRALVALGGLAVFAGVMLAGDRPAATPRLSADSGDVALFRAIVDDVRAGDPYYDAFGTELRTRHYPVRSLFNWRTPLLYRTLAWSSVDVGQWLLIGLSTLLLIAAIRGPDRPLTPFFLTHALIVVLFREPLYFTELWAGVCLGLSAAAYAAERRLQGVAWAILGLAVRELAAPYCVAATLLAVWQRQWREVRAWALGATLYAGYYGWHASQVRQHIQPGDLAHAHSWLFSGGWVFLLRAIQSTGLLFLVPTPVFAAFIVAVVAAGWARNMPVHVRLGVLVYAAFFVCAGQPFNLYGDTWSRPCSPCGWRIRRMAWLPCWAPTGRVRLRHGRNPAKTERLMVARIAGGGLPVAAARAWWRPGATRVAAMGV